MGSGIFVTGTDTGVGKTRIASALLRAFAQAGKSAVGMKPVAAGRENGRWEDVDAVMRASNVSVPRELVNPYAFEPPIAPHIAARLAGVEIDLENIARAYAALALRADVVVVEGAGGFMIPLNARQSSADLARRLGLPIVLVVGMRLGCLNHALLTHHAVQDAGLECAAWVANCIDPDMPYLQENIMSLRERLPCPLLTIEPYQPAAEAEISLSSLAPLLRNPA
jgi:dethiobiotin synthetase